MGVACLKNSVSSCHRSHAREQSSKVLKFECDIRVCHVTSKLSMCMTRSHMKSGSILHCSSYFVIRVGER